MSARRLGAFLVLATVVGIGGASPASAHVKASSGYSEIRADDDGSVEYRLALEYRVLARAAALDPSQIDAPTDRARADALGRGLGRQRAGAYLLERVVVRLDAATCAGSYEGASVAPREGVAYADLSLRFDCPGEGSGTFRIDYDVFSTTDAVVDDHTNLVDYDLGGVRGQVIVDANRRSFEAGDGGHIPALLRFGRLGLEHLFSGPDHLLFLLALLLGATSRRAVFELASMFTVAHSITLVLSAAGSVHVPSTIVEPLIALSIAFVALDNILGGSPGRHRLATVFAFGLLHGLGFAGALSFTGDVSWAQLVSLVGFNAGIELGQAVLVGALLPLLALTHRLTWSTALQTGTTAVVGTTGLVWFFQRVMFI